MAAQNKINETSNDNQQMAAETGQEKEEANQNNDSVVNSVVAGKSLSCWKSPLKRIINIAEFFQRVKGYTHLIKEDGFLVDLRELKKVERRIVSVFVVDKRLCKICRLMKDNIKSLTSLVVKPQRIIKGTGYFTWNILLHTPEDCVGITSHDFITKDLILRREYEGRQSTI